MEITRLIKKMGDEFEIKGPGNPKYFLGREVARSREGIYVSRSTLNLLKETSMTRCKLVDISIKLNAKPRNFVDKVPVDKGKYKCLVGKLIYQSYTRPDISYTASIFSQFL